MSKIYNGIMGLIVGDALGVPVEFKKRDTYKITGMTGYGTHNQPPGTWSDDSSMQLAGGGTRGRLRLMGKCLMWAEQHAARLIDIPKVCRLRNAAVRKLRIMETEP